MLLPGLAPGGSTELGDIRVACAEAVTAMLSSSPEVVVCAGAGEQRRRYDESAGGSAHGFGVDTRVGGGSSELPLALTVGAWLLDRAGWTGPRRYVELPPETTPEECAAIGDSTASADLRVGVLTMGDGSAKRSNSAPGYLDEGAGPFDAEVTRALSAPDFGWLVNGISPELCTELWVAGRQAWQFLAGAARQAPRDGEVAARLHYQGAPYGVGYVVVSWQVTGSTRRS